LTSDIFVGSTNKHKQYEEQIMKKLRLLLPVAALAATGLTSATAQLFEEESPFAANIGVTSNYVWRGVSQTDNGAAVQGGLDYADPSGAYIGVWTSNIGDGTSSEAELDIYGGFAGAYEALDYDVGVIAYLYPSGNSDDNFYEVYAELGFEFVFVGAAYTFASGNNNGQFSSGDIYVYGGLGFDIYQDLYASITIGQYWFDDASGADYLHGQIDIIKSTDFGDFGFSASLAERESGNSDPLFFASWGIDF